jgi:hypothetical protein
VLETALGGARVLSRTQASLQELPRKGGLLAQGARAVNAGKLRACTALGRARARSKTQFPMQERTR